MEENGSILHFEKVHDSEINDIWDIFFPKTAEKKEKAKKLSIDKKSKPRRYLKFLTI